MKKGLVVLLGVAACIFIIQGVGMGADKPKKKEAVSPEQKAEAVFVKMDTDKDGKISKLEYVTYYQAKAEDKFGKLDKDGDTYLVKEEITITKVPNKSKGESTGAAKKPSAAK